MAYVYKHTRIDTNEVFYIGIGSDKTKYRSRNKNDRTVFWKNITNKTEYKIDIIYDNISRKEAESLEKTLIKKHGRRDLRKGTLVNLTDGGEGREIRYIKLNLNT